ncbi:class 1 fructose-bisphosphatase [Aestuariicoccus sp. KMU-90]|uniref:Fructose-1,6-bisphosphatase class 1 n=2 Tax=Thetidibacter halocola TaxID=2827239 RepID=A0A8J8B740_9RHOB|nr:class 1 fructose-bisphosphatase [Thetidibacter halocola]MBS0124022.1 class 1 fructose-bisphosphatase [Thetidibacter halocola]
MIAMPERAIPDTLSPIVEALCSVAADLSARISLGPLGADLGAAVGANTDGDQQKALDVIADDAFRTALRGTGLRWYASEERETVELIDATGHLALAIDPLDGSSNIDANVSIGTIFCIRDALDDGNATFLRDGRSILASGYFIYGPQTALVVTFGAGVRQFVMDRATGTFRETPSAPSIPAQASEFAINASNYRHWAQPIRAYIDDCLAGIEGPRGKNFNMRWVASLVAETHRIMSRGGIFLYPGDERPGYERGRLRMVYECHPIAYLVEQAGGAATDGERPILDIAPDSLHARTPFVFGTADKVARVATYHDLPAQEVSALFGNRGLFRA